MAENPVSNTSLALVLAFKTSRFARAEYITDVLQIRQSALLSCVMSTVHVEKLLSMVPESRWVTQLGFFSVGEKNLPADR